MVAHKLGHVDTEAAVSVVDLFLLLVSENCVCFRNGLELASLLFVAPMLLRMVLIGQLVVRLDDILSLARLFVQT